MESKTYNIKCWLKYYKRGIEIISLIFLSIIILITPPQIEIFSVGAWLIAQLASVLVYHCQLELYSFEFSVTSVTVFTVFKTFFKILEIWYILPTLKQCFL